MRYLKLFESFGRFEQEFGKFKIKVEDASASDGVQVDEVTINLIGVGEDDYEYYFDLHTSTNGSSSVKFIGSNTIYIKLNKNTKKGFIENFNLVEGEFIDSENDLFEFLQVNSDSCVGDSTEIDGFELEITNFNHDGGYEIGYLETIVNGEEIQIEMKQDSSGGFEVYFSTDEDEELAKKIGFEITDEISEYLFTTYDTITLEKR